MHSHKWEKSVNSSTSSSDANRSYVRWVLVFAFLPALSLFFYGIFLQPLYGDLTRIGLYSEREFGWNKAQKQFPSPAYKQDRYDHYQDVVILGDSFSRAWPDHQWQNHLIATTGWSMTTLDINTVDVAQILANPVFQKSPPQVFILESVERLFADRIAETPACKTPGTMPPSPSQHLPALNDKAHPPFDASDVSRSKNWNDVKLEFAWKYFKNAMRAARGEQRQTKVRKLRLTKEGLFSSANQRDILIYGEDLEKKKRWASMPLSEMSCRIQQIRAQVERNGVTRFVLLLAPDKLTAYADHLADRQLAHISMLAAFAQQNEALTPRVDLALRSAIDRAEQDIYLPDDTHWGSTGHKIAADTIRAFLLRQPGIQAADAPFTRRHQ